MKINNLVLGIGGSGMASLSHLLLDYGENIIGYDAKKSNQTKILEERGVKIFYDFPSFLQFHLEKNIHQTIVSSAIRNSPFLDWSKKNGIPIIHRSEALHKKMDEKKSISIAGAHGKTTTTGMVAQILIEACLDPAIMIGGEFPLLDGKGGRWGKGIYGVYESDESDGTFLNHSANYKLLTNIDEDHLDFYKTKENLYQAFLKYLDAKYGYSFLTALDKNTIELIPLIPNKEQTILIIPKELELSSIHIQNFYKIYTFHCNSKTAELKELNGKTYTIQVGFPGEQYLKNASLAFAFAKEIGISEEIILNSLLKYKGIKRRMEILYKGNGILILDDYGHHPTEISAVLDSMEKLKIQNQIKRLVIIFQPHRYTRTQMFYREFANCLKRADVLFILPIYPADEREIPGVSSQLIVDEFIANKPILLSGILEQDVGKIKPIIQEGDGILCVGAGNVYEWGIALSQEWNPQLANKS